MAAPKTPRSVQMLSQEVIHRIAAGEVIERPASVLKELLDNALDAGATRVQVTVVDGGLKSIEVSDDGWGLSREDLSMCVRRHATSKIKNLDDLDEIFSLGFRGEALAAVASVSALTMETFREGDGSWKLEVKGGLSTTVSPGTRRKGTLVKVEGLFFNTPARLKFLKKPSIEGQECQNLFESVSLAHPGVHMEFYLVDANGEVRDSLDLPASDLKERFARVIGQKGEILEAKVGSPQPGVNELHILAFAPPVSSRAQTSVRLTVNGRPILDKRLPYALREAYAGLIEVGYFPHVLIRVDVDPKEIDVNIHPQKKEIRFPDGFSMGSLVYRYVRPLFEVKVAPTQPLAEQLPLSFFEPSSSPAASHGAEASAGLEPALLAHTATPQAEIVPWVPPSLPVVTTRAMPVSNNAAYDRPAFRFSDLRVVGEAGAAWIVCESSRGLVLIDQHAAHERCEFERILSSKDLIRSRLLLVPLALNLPKALFGQEAAVRTALESLGFEVSDAEVTDKGVLEIIAVPEGDRRIDWDDEIRAIFETLSRGEDVGDAKTKIQVRLAASLACHGSVRRGQRLSNDEIQALLKQMDQVRWGGFCPHGRPVWIEFTHEDIASRFHR